MKKSLLFLFVISMTMLAVSEEKNSHAGSFAAGMGGAFGDRFGESFYKDLEKRHFDSLEGKHGNDIKYMKRISDLRLKVAKRFDIRCVVCRCLGVILFGCVAGSVTNKLIVTK